MSNIASLADFRKSDKVHALEMLDYLRGKVENGEIEAFLFIAFDPDMGAAETYALNTCALDFVEAVGTLELAKFNLIQASMVADE